MEDSGAVFREEPCLIQEKKTTGSISSIFSSTVTSQEVKLLWQHLNLAVMGDSNPWDGTKAIAEQGCSFVSLWQSRGLPSLLLLQVRNPDTKNWRFLLRWFQRCLLATSLLSFCLGSPSMVCLLLSTCQPQFRLASSKTTTDFGLC